MLKKLFEWLGICQKGHQLLLKFYKNVQILLFDECLELASDVVCIIVGFNQLQKDRKANLIASLNRNLTEKPIFLKRSL